MSAKPQPGQDPLRPDHKVPVELAAMSVALRFAEFAIENIDLAREFLVSKRWSGGEVGPRLKIVLALERNAGRLDLGGFVCQRPIESTRMKRCSPAHFLINPPRI